MEEFSIIDFLQYYKRKIKLLIIFLCIGLISGFIFHFYIQVPLYKSETSILMIRSESVQPITQNDLILIKNLAPTYSEYLKSRKVLSQVIQKLNLDITAKKLSSRIDIVNITDTAMFSISVIDEKSDTAAEIANELANVFIKELSNNFNNQNVTVVDKAVPNSNPINVHLKKQYSFIIGISFIIATIIIFMLFYFDNTIKTAADIEKKIGLNILTSIPRQKQKRKNNTDKDALSLEKLSNSKLKKIYDLYSKLQFLLIHQKIKTLLITSNSEKDNSNFIINNLALLFADKGLKVLLINNTKLEEEQKNFSNNLSLKTCQESIEKTEIPNLFIMPNILFNDEGTFISTEVEKRKKIFSLLKEQYDIIIFNSFLINTSTLLLSTLVDGVIMVATQNTTSISTLETTRNNFNDINANILGVIFNKN